MAETAAPAIVIPVFRDGATAARSVAEDAAAGAPVGSAVTASDSDGDSIAYSLAGDDASLFAIDTGTGQISVAQGTALDFETRSSYSVSARANDGRTGQDTITVTITVTNVEEAGTVSLSSANPEVGVTLTAMLEDPDGGVSERQLEMGALSGQHDLDPHIRGDFEHLHACGNRRG